MEMSGITVTTTTRQYFYAIAIRLISYAAVVGLSA